MLCLAGVLLSTLLPLLIFGLTSYATVQALGSLTYHEHHYQRLALALTPSRYALLRGGLAGIVLAAGGALWLWHRTNMLAEWQLLGREVRPAVTCLRHAWRALSASERRIGKGLLLILFLVRVWWLVASALSTDEAASFDYFIHEGPVAIASYYPIPNNHPLFNLMCWPLSQLTSNLQVVMRLPTLLVATAGTRLAYRMLTRQVGFVAATLGMGLFSFSPLGLTYAVMGRGYFLQLTLLLLAFFAALTLLQRTRSTRLAWTTFGGASIAGLYTIPTFIYPLAALEVGLLLGFARARRWADVGHLVLVGATVIVAAALLYAPVVAVSGLPRLLANQYVAPLSATKFWPRYAGHLHVQADALTGIGYLGIVAAVGLVLLGLVLWRRQPARRPLLGLLGLLLTVPVVLMAGQRVLAPARVLLFMGCFGSILAGLGGAAVLAWLRVPKRWQLLGVLLLIGSYASYQVVREVAPMEAARRRARLLQASYRWLTTHGARRVWLASPRHELFWHHYALVEKRPLLLETEKTPGQTYDYVVVQPSAPALPVWAHSSHYVPVYRDEIVVIYGLVKQ